MTGPLKPPAATLGSAPDQADPAEPARRPALLLAVAAGLCWACALAMLLTLGLDVELNPLAPARVIFYLLLLAAGLLTFVPMQRQLALPGLALEGVAGSFLLFYVLAFVPPPTGSLLLLSDTPVYLLFIGALFWSSSAVVMPLVFMIGRRLFHQRARQFDLRRARRQAHELGGLLALCAALAGLRLLTPLSVLLLALILIVAEMLCLSFIETAP